MRKSESGNSGGVPSFDGAKIDGGGSRYPHQPSKCCERFVNVLAGRVQHEAGCWFQDPLTRTDGQGAGPAIFGP